MLIWQAMKPSSIFKYFKKSEKLVYLSSDGECEYGELIPMSDSADKSISKSDSVDKSIPTTGWVDKPISTTVDDASKTSSVLPTSTKSKGVRKHKF